MFKVVFRILSPLVLGVVLFVFFLQQSINIQNHVSVQVSNYLQKNFDLDVKFSGFYVNFFSVSAFSQECLIKISSKKKLDIRFQKIRLQLSDLVTLLQKKISLILKVNSIYVDNVESNKYESGFVDNFHLSTSIAFEKILNLKFYGYFDFPFLKNKNFKFNGCLGKEDNFLKCFSKDVVFNSIYYFLSDSVNADFKINFFKKFNFVGNTEWNFVKKFGSALIQNSKLLSSEFGLVKKNDFKLSLDFNLEKIKGTYFIKSNNNKDSKQKFTTKGFLSFKNEDLILKGATNISNYLIKINYFPNFFISKFLLFKGKKKFIDLKCNNLNKDLSGQVNSDFVKIFLSQTYKRLFLTNKLQFNIEFSQNDFSKIRGKIGFKNSKFYIPDSFNLIEDLDLDFIFSFKKKIIELYNLKVNCHKGNLFSERSKIKFNEDFSLKSVFLPIKIKNLLVNLEKDFYGFIQGDLLIQKRKETFFDLKGDITFKKSIMKESFLSRQWENDEISYLDFLNSKKIFFKSNINFKNEQPVKIRTDFLNAEANLDVNVKNIQLKNGAEYYQFSGNVDCVKGELNFLRNKLYIEDCKIEFTPNKSQSPSIYLTAKNKIKKYFITMKMDGYLDQINYNFESWPDLKEEQILALLMAGSENASFKTDLPVILLQNLNDWVTGNKDIKTKNFFKKITLPFKYIQITPDFADQSGRGGVKGTISVVLNKQLHAKIQKNFNLQEDFAFQVEYLLTDDINLKIVKDQRGDLGSEVELRFKF